MDWNCYLFSLFCWKYLWFFSFNSHYPISLYTRLGFFFRSWVIPLFCSAFLSWSLRDIFPCSYWVTFLLLLESLECSLGPAILPKCSLFKFSFLLQFSSSVFFQAFQCRVLGLPKTSRRFCSFHSLPCFISVDGNYKIIFPVSWYVFCTSTVFLNRSATSILLLLSLNICHTVLWWKISSAHLHLQLSVVSVFARYPLLDSF